MLTSEWGNFNRSSTKSVHVYKKNITWFGL